MNTQVQEAICRKYGAAFLAAPENLKIGISESALNGSLPLHGLRHPPEADTAGWYIWAGDYSEDEDFFKPIHIEHLTQACPQVIKFLGMSPGWRFLLAGEYEDVWYDIELLKMR